MSSVQIFAIVLAIVALASAQYYGYNSYAYPGYGYSSYYNSYPAASYGYGYK